jgi:hypothetical protein
MSDKYPYQSPYVYCGNNPLKIIDPNGEDEWELNEVGNLKWVAENKDKNIVTAIKTGESSEYSVGTIKEMRKGFGEIMNNGIKETVDYDYIDIKNDEAGTKFFEFAAQNTNVEWSHIQSDNNDNRIATTCEEATDVSSSIIVADFINKGINVRKDVHSHPDLPRILPKPSSGDIDYSIFAKNTYGDKAPPTSVYSKINGKWDYTSYGIYGKSFNKILLFEGIVKDTSSHIVPTKRTPKIYKLELINPELKQIIDSIFNSRGLMLFIKISKYSKSNFELKITCEQTQLIKRLLTVEFRNKDLIGFFEYNGMVGAVFGEKNNPFFKLVKKIVPPSFYPIKYKKRNTIKVSEFLHSQYPPSRYDGYVMQYYRYINSEMIFDRVALQNTEGHRFNRVLLGKKYKDILDPDRK